MKPFAVTLFVEAEDAVQAITVACDVALDEEALQRAAALDDGTVKVRPVRPSERGGAGR